MKLWPSRSRPVVTPFKDDFSGRVIILPGVFNTQVVDLTIPPDVYVSPTAIQHRAITIAGIRGMTLNSLVFLRGDVPFAASSSQFLRSNQTYRYFFAASGERAPRTILMPLEFSILPHPLYLYPNDVLRFTFTEFLAGDVFDQFTIHGKVWEVH